MTFDNRRGAFPYLDRLPQFALSGLGARLLIMTLVAAGFAFFLSLPETSVRAWHQLPTAPRSPVPTQIKQLPTLSSTAPVITSTPTPETRAPSPLGQQLPQDSERSTALLVAGGIVLAGLIAGVVVFLLEGVMSS
jgi:hypothetical protein